MVSVGNMIMIGISLFESPFDCICYLYTYQGKR